MTAKKFDRAEMTEERKDFKKTSAQVESYDSFPPPSFSNILLQRPRRTGHQQNSFIDALVELA